MAFINLLKSSSCVNSCINESFYSFHDTYANKESKVQFVDSYIEKICDITDFSAYHAITEKFKLLISNHNLLYRFKNESILFECNDKRVTLVGNPKEKTEKKKYEKIDKSKEKDRKSRKRSAQIAEISTIYEENESGDKLKQGEQNLQLEIKKTFQEKQPKTMEKECEPLLNIEKLNLIETKKKTKKIRLSDETEANKITTKNNNLRKSGKKSVTKKNIVKRLSLIKNNLNTNKKEESVSFIERIEKVDKANGISGLKNLKTSFKFTPTNKTICISKIPSKNSSSNVSPKKLNVLPGSNQSVSKTAITKTPIVVNGKTNNKTDSNGLFARPKSKVKEIIEQFGAKFKKAANKFTNHPKKFSIIRSSIGERKARISLAKQQIKRRSVKNVNHFVKEIAKEINKTTGQINSNNNSLMNMSTHSQKIVNSVRKNPLVVNHKMVNNQIKVNNRSKVLNNNSEKNISASKSNQNNFKINQIAKKINPEDLRYDSNRCKVMMDQKKLANERIIRVGSTSTISSLNSSNASLYSLKQDMQSFKTVNTTFDSLLKVEKTNTIQKNTTFCIKPSSTRPNNQTKQDFNNPQKIIKNEKFKIDQTKVAKNVKPNSHKISNSTIVISNQTKTALHNKRSNSIDNSIWKSNNDNYGIEEIRSCDETDDEDEPNKPIPVWAQKAQETVKMQAREFINFTKLFKSSTNENVNLEEIFQEKKKRFYQRSSSADWKSPTVWRSNGLNGEESFRKLHIN